MTDPNAALIQRVRDLLGEHSISFVVAMTVPTEEDEMKNCTVLVCSGDFSQQVGLCERLRNELREQDHPQKTNEDEGDDWKKPA